MINKWISDPIDLPIRIKEAIRKKERKPYRESPLWLIIYLDDDITSKTNIESLLENYKLNLDNTKFSRIYILSSYCPVIDGYPLFRIK